MVSPHCACAFLSDNGSQNFGLEDLLDISAPFVLVTSEFVQRKFRDRGYLAPPHMIRVLGEVGPAENTHLDYRNILSDAGERWVRQGKGIWLSHVGELEFYRLRKNVEQFPGKTYSSPVEWNFHTQLIYSDVPEVFSSARWSDIS